MQLTCVEEEGTAIWAVNIQKKIFIRKISLQTEVQETQYMVENWS